MKSISSTGVALFGAALDAISYGLARFAFGLFVPPIRAELDLSPDLIGIIGALPLISFLLAALLSPLYPRYPDYERDEEAPEDTSADSHPPVR